MNSMVDGQDAQTIVSDNARFMFRRDLASDLINATLQPPVTVTEQAYGHPVSGIQLLDSAIEACKGDSGYVGISLMQWGSNPFSMNNDSHVVTSQLKFDSFAWNTNYTAPAIPTIAYYIVNQFSKPQNFNFSIPLEDILAMQLPNFTFPECTMYDGLEYTPCYGCNVSTYTNHNVTFACTDPRQLCGSGADSRRLSDSTSHRLLQSNGEDDDTESVSSADSIQYAALVNAIGNQISSTLSQNPFAVDWAKASAIVTFVGLFFFFMVLGYVFFSKWDKTDRGFLVYAKNESDRAKLKLRHEYMLKRQMEGLSSVKALAPELVKGKKMFHISESTYQVLQEAFEVEHKQKINVRKRMTGMWSRFKQRFGLDFGCVLDAGEKPVGRPILKSSASQSEHLFKLFHEEETHRHLEYNAVFEEDDLMETRDELYIANVVADFLNSVMPEGSVSQGNKRWVDSMHRMLKEHDYTAMFYDPSLKYPRSLRWLNICLQLLINLFVDTIFFGIFFPDTGLCEGYMTEQECVEPQNAVMGTSLCIWYDDTQRTNGGSCGLTPPPNDFTFQCILVVLCQVAGLPIAFFYDFLLKEYCTRRPNLEKWGLNTTYFLGRSTQNKHHGATQEVTESRLKDVFNEVDELRRKAHDADIVQFLFSKKEREARELEETNFISTRLYGEFAYSTEEEAEQMLQEVKHFLDEYIDYQHVPWQSSKVSAIRHAKVRAVQD